MANSIAVIIILLILRTICSVSGCNFDGDCSTDELCSWRTHLCMRRPEKLGDTCSKDSDCSFTTGTECRNDICSCLDGKFQQGNHCYDSMSTATIIGFVLIVFFLPVFIVILISCFLKKCAPPPASRGVNRRRHATPPPSYRLTWLDVERTPFGNGIRPPSYTNPPSFATAVGLKRQSNTSAV